MPRNRGRFPQGARPSLSQPLVPVPGIDARKNFKTSVISQSVISELRNSPLSESLSLKSGYESRLCANSGDMIPVSLLPLLPWVKASWPHQCLSTSACVHATCFLASFRVPVLRLSV